MSAIYLHSRFLHRCMHGMHARLLLCAQSFSHASREDVLKQRPRAANESFSICVCQCECLIFFHVQGRCYQTISWLVHHAHMTMPMSERTRSMIQFTTAPALLVEAIESDSENPTVASAALSTLTSCGSLFIPLQLLKRLGAAFLFC